MEKGITQKELADHIGISGRYVCSIEKGRMPGIYIAIKISRFFDRTVDEIFRVC